MAKLLRKRKQFGRCNVPGHGQSNVGTDHQHRCEVTADIQDTPFTRAQEKREWVREVSEEMELVK